MLIFIQLHISWCPLTYQRTLSFRSTSNWEKTWYHLFYLFLWSLRTQGGFIGVCGDGSVMGMEDGRIMVSCIGEQGLCSLLTIFWVHCGVWWFAFFSERTVTWSSRFLSNSECRVLLLMETIMFRGHLPTLLCLSPADMSTASLQRGVLRSFSEFCPLLWPSVEVFYGFHNKWP